MEEFSKWIITCLCTEVSQHGGILSEAGSSTGEVHRIKFELFEEFCPFGTLRNMSLSKADEVILSILSHPVLRGVSLQSI